MPTLLKVLDQAATTATATYTPVFTSDGSACSKFIRGTTVRYRQQGSIVFVSIYAVFGQSVAGGGGTYVKMSLPPGLPGKTGVSQHGLGHVAKTQNSVVSLTVGSAAIESSDVNNFILTKQEVSYWTDGDAALGGGFNWTFNGSYETN